MKFQTIDKALEILCLKEATRGRLRKIKLDVFKYRHQAERTYYESAAHGASFEVLAADYQILLAWETLIRFWCQQCGMVVLKWHDHCPDCGRIVKQSERQLHEEAALITRKCKCGWEDVDVLD